MMTRELGHGKTQEILQGHESGDDNPEGEKKMDSSNNAAGMRLASQEGDCTNNAAGALRTGQLDTNASD